MPYSQLPFRPHKFILESELKGLEIGGCFRDGKGRIFRLWRLSDALVAGAGSADEVKDGEVMVLAAGGVITNDVSAGLDATNPMAAGVMQFDSAGADAATTTIGESEGTTTALRRCVLVMIKGVHDTVATNGDDDIAASDLLIPVADGEVDSFAPTTVDPTLAELTKMMQSVFATAIAADVDGDDTVQALVNVPF